MPHAEHTTADLERCVVAHADADANRAARGARRLATAAREPLLQRCARRLRRLADDVAEFRIRARRAPWPCVSRKYLVVGCESSGTTPISHLLFRTGPTRFLIEGDNPWVWALYQAVYQGHRRVRDYPRLQLYDSLKVPGFAAILPQLLEEFPNTSVIYVLRDPRDVVVSAYKTHQLTARDQLGSIAWVRQTWLGIRDEDPVARLAWRWRLYLERSQQVPGVTYVRYEDFCADKVGCIRRWASRLELQVDEGQIRRVCDRQASTPDARDYRPEGPGAWRNSYLTDHDAAIIEGICGTHMRRWGYDVSTQG